MLCRHGNPKAGMETDAQLIAEHQLCGRGRENQEVLEPLTTRNLPPKVRREGLCHKNEKQWKDTQPDNSPQTLESPPPSLHVNSFNSQLLNS